MWIQQNIEAREQANKAGSKHQCSHANHLINTTTHLTPAQLTGYRLPSTELPAPATPPHQHCGQCRFPHSTHAAQLAKLENSVQEETSKHPDGNVGSNKVNEVSKPQDAGGSLQYNGCDLFAHELNKAPVSPAFACADFCPDGQATQRSPYNC